jgi:hypothetical protein
MKKCCLRSQKEVHEAVIAERCALSVLVDWIDTMECNNHWFWPFLAILHADELARRYAFTIEHEERVLRVGFKLPDWGAESLRIRDAIFRYPLAVSTFQELQARRWRAA